MTFLPDETKIKRHNMMDPLFDVVQLEGFIEIVQFVTKEKRNTTVFLD